MAKLFGIDPVTIEVDELTVETQDVEAAVNTVNSTLMAGIDVELPGRTVITVTLAATQITSAVDVPEGTKVMSVYIPSLTSCTLSIEGSVGGTNFGVIKGSMEDVVGYSWSATTGNFVIALVPVAGITKVRLSSSVSQTCTFELGFI